MSTYECSITNPKKQLEFYKDLSEQLQVENKQLNQKYLNAVSDYEQEKFNVEELKKQLEKANTTLDTHNELIEYMKNQQKEFISYLEEKEKEFDILGDPKNSGACKGILQKYKEIIGKDINVSTKRGKDE